MSSRRMFDGIIRSVEGAARSPARGSMPRMGQRRPTGRTPLSARRRKARAYVYALLVLLSFSLVGGIAWATHHPRLEIVSIDVRGEEFVLQTEIESTARSVLDDGMFHIVSTRNIFIYPRADLQHKILSTFPRIESVHIERPGVFSQTLVITIEERAVWAKWCKNETCYLMDSGGYVYAEASGEQGGYIFSGGLSAADSPINQIFLRGNLARVNEMLAYLDGKKYSAIGADVLGEKDYTIQLQNGLRVHVPFDGEPDVLVRNLETVLTSEVLSGKVDNLYYVDLRYGNRVYYGFDEQQGDQEVSIVE